MKTTRRIFSMVLALMMVLSLSVTAFADTTIGTATFKLMVDGVEVPKATDTEVAAGQSVYAYLTGKYGTDGWYSFPDVNQNTAYSLYSLTVDGTTYASGAVDGATSGVQATAWSTTRPGYGFVDFAYDDNGNEVGYIYVYVGRDFLYSVTNAGNTVDVSDKYMNQYTIQNGDVIELSLATTSMTWTATDPIQAEYPYC